jgi:hypothetical protein
LVEVKLTSLGVDTRQLGGAAAAVGAAKS